MKKKKLLSLTILFFLSFVLLSQNQFSSEDDLKKQAAALFEDKKFVQATPLYAQLLSLYPKEAEYNFKYGTCLLASESDKSKAIKYLEFSNSYATTNPLVHYYLGKAYHLNYDFAKAVKQYSNFKRKASSKDVETYQVDRQIEMCKNGNELLSKLNEVQVLEVQEIAEKDFFRIYRLDGINGKIIAKPADFQSKYDQKLAEKSIVYLPENANEVYYSSYGKKGENGKDIHKSIKLSNGQWSEGVSIGASINTPFDEDYPFIHPDGKTLYFASKGHSSMGGYDLFKSTFDETTAQWSTPENLDFAFNSTNDDILFVTDYRQEIAYFASNRSNSEGKVTVYKVLVERAPAELSAITGSFIAEDNPSQKKAKITVIEKASNKTVGVYETDENGKYLIEIPKNGGDYQFNIETTEDAPIHTGLVSIPEQEQFELLGQELRLVNKDGQQQLVIKNIFDGSIAKNVNTKIPQVSSSLLKMKANLSVNFSENQLANLKSGDSTEELTAAKENTAKPIERETAKTAQNRESEKTNLSTSIDLEKEKADLATLSKDFFNEIKKQESLKNATYASAIQYQQQAENQFKASPNSEDGKILATKAAFTLEAAKEMEKNLDEVKVDHLKFKNDSADLIELIEQNQVQESKNLAEELSGYSKLLLVKSNANKVLENKVKDAQKNSQNVEKQLTQINEREKGFADELLSKNEALNALKLKAEKAKGKDKENLDKQISELALDIEDINYRQNLLIAEKNQLEQSLNALALQSQTLNDLSNQLSNEEATIVSKNELVTESQKNNLEQNLKRYQSNGQLAYEESSTKVEASAQSEARAETAKIEPVKKEVIPEASKTVADLKTDETAVKPSLEEINQKYSTELEDAVGFNAKASLYSEWQEELKSTLNQQEAELSTASGKEKKALQKEIKETKAQINTVNEERNKLEEEPLIASKTVPKAQLGSLSAINNSYNNSLQTIEKENNVALKQTQTSELYAIWREDLENLMMAKEAEISSVETAEERNELINEVNLIQQKIDELSFSILKAEETSANIVTDFNRDISEISDESIIPDNFTNLKFEQSIQFGNQRPSQTMAFAKKAMYEAGKIANEASKINESAYTLPTPEQRTEAFAKSNELKKLSDEKLLEAAEYFAKYNREEYQINARRLENAQQFEEEFESRALDLALLLSDEAESFFRNASEIRANINPSDRLSRKEVELQKAYDLEILAIEKQREAFEKLEIADDNYMKQAEIASNSNKSQFIQAITDDRILSITSTAEIQTKLDSINKENERLNVQSALVENLILETPVGNKRDSLIAINEGISSKLNENKTLAAVYYEREKQIYQGTSATPKRESSYSSLIKPLEANYDRTVELDTVYVDDQRKELLLKNRAFIEYAQVKAKQADMMNEAKLEYQLATNLTDENLQLRRKAIIENNMIEMEQDETERQRLVKSAEVINIRIAKNEEKIDSLNNRVKLKNLLISQYENQEKQLLSGLNEIEKQEYASLAFSPETKALLEQQNELLASQNTSETGGGEVIARETSERTQPSESLREEYRTLPKVEVEDATNEPSELAEKQENLSSEELANETKVESQNEAPKSDNVAESRSDLTEENLNNQAKPKSATKKELETAAVSEKVVPTKEEPVKTEKLTPKSESPVKVEKTEANKPTVVSASNIDNIPREVKQAIFITLDRGQSAYGSGNPIPVNPNLPEGLIYKIQVGAFRNPIPQNLFKGFAPIMAEETGLGITRYTAGVFVDENSAINARNQIRQLGYKDAFVVAFLNGKRVSLAQARGGAAAPAESNSTFNSQLNKEQDAVKELSPAFAAANVEKVVSSSAIDKLFFTIQIGVFSKPVPKGKFNLKDLNVVELPNGLIRYNAGIFDNAIDAGELKLDLQKTIPDAFITAYYKGKRISINEAARLKNK